MPSEHLVERAPQRGLARARGRQGVVRGAIDAVEGSTGGVMDDLPATSLATKPDSADTAIIAELSSDSIVDRLPVTS